MELRDYANTLWRRKWIVILTTIATITTVVIGTYLTTPIYETSTTVRIAVSALDTQNTAIYNYNEQLMNTYVEIATSRPILIELADGLDLSQTTNIKVELVPNTELIKITVEDSDPKLAATIANTLADILITQSNQLFTGGERNSQEVLTDQLAQAQTELDQTRQTYAKLIIQTPPVPQNIEATRQLLQIQQTNYATLLNQYEQAQLREEIRANMITVVETAPVPEVPSSPRASLNYVLGLMAGLLGGLGLAFIFENFDANINTTKEIEAATKMNALAKLPHANRKQLNMSLNSDSPLGEAFRKLVLGIQAIDPRQQKKVLLVMSPEPEQGVSTVVSNLACALSEYGNNVIAVDCNLRQPGLHSFFGLPNENGLTDVLERKVDLNRAIQNGPNDCLHVLTSGVVPAHPGQLLASTPMAKLINDLGQRFDFVLMDTPALLAVADIQTLAQEAGGLILVVRRAHAQREALHEAMKFLAGYPDKFIGLIINEAEINNNYGFYQYKRTPEPVQNEVG